MDDLKEVIDENMRSRQQAAQQAEEIIDTQVLHFMDWLGSLDAAATIRDLRMQAEGISREALDAALKKLQQGADPEQVLGQVVRNLTNKLIHHPSTRLRNASELGREDLLLAARELFNLSANTPRSEKDK